MSEEPTTKKFGSIEMTELEHPEYWREYHFPVHSIRVLDVTHIHVKVGLNGHSHRLLCRDGTSWYIPTGWLAISSKHDGWTF